MRYFETIFLEEANDFIAKLEPKLSRKVLYHIDLAEQTNDVSFFKKLQNDIWEFRTGYSGLQIRLLAFWDKICNHRTLVIATHGFFKKSKKTPAKEINKAAILRKEYMKHKKSEGSYG